MKAWDWVAYLVTQLYEALCAQGSLGCYAMVFAGTRLATWGLRLTDGRRSGSILAHREPQAPAWLRRAAGQRHARAVGCLLQVAGAAWAALAAVALVRVLAQG